MSAYLLGMGFKCDMATCARKLVLLKLIDACEEDGTRIYPAVSTIARAAQCSARQVQRELKAFVDTGLLRIVREGGRGPGSTREYAMDLDVLRRLSDVGWDALARGADGGAGGEADRDSMGDTVSPLQPDAKGDTADGGRVTGGAPKGDTGSHPTPPDPSNNPSSERERASAGDRDGENPKEARGVASRAAGTQGDTVADLDLFERGKRRWPKAIGGNRDRELKVWARLSDHDRIEAERSIEAVVEELKRAKRSHLPGWETYLRNRDWELLPRHKRAKPTRTAVVKRGKEYLALALKLIDEGRPLQPLAEALRPMAQGLSWPVEDMPGGAAIAAHTQRIRHDSLEGFAWGRWFAERGLDLMLDGPADDPHWLWLPERWPPGWDGARAERERAAAAAAPKMSPETARRLREMGIDAAE